VCKKTKSSVDKPECSYFKIETGLREETSNYKFSIVNFPEIENEKIEKYIKSNINTTIYELILNSSFDQNPTIKPELQFNVEKFISTFGTQSYKITYKDIPINPHRIPTFITIDNKGTPLQFKDLFNSREIYSKINELGIKKGLDPTKFNTFYTDFLLSETEFHIVVSSLVEKPKTIKIPIAEIEEYLVKH